MRMAPEGSVVDVQLAICCGPAARARKPPRNHTGRMAFSNARAWDSAHFPKELLCTSQTLSFRCSQWDFQKTSSTGAMTPCGAFVGVQNETARVEVATAWLTHQPKIITPPHLGPSPRAAPLQTGIPLPDCVTGGLSTRPEETYWHSTAGVMSLLGIYL